MAPCGGGFPSQRVSNVESVSMPCRQHDYDYKLWFRAPYVWLHSDRVRSHVRCVRNPHGLLHDDVIKWKHFPRYWPFVRGIHRSPVNSPHKGQWRGALMFTLICVRINGWVNNCETGDLRRNRGHYDVIVMTFLIGNVSTGVVTRSALRCGACGESGKNVAAAPLSKTVAMAAAAETWFAKLLFDYMLHNRFLETVRSPQRHVITLLSAPKFVRSRMPPMWP